MLPSSAVVMATPSPVPPLACFVVKKGSLMRRRSASEIPVPWSSTTSITRLFVTSQDVDTVTPRFAVRQGLEGIDQQITHDLAELRCITECRRQVRREVCAKVSGAVVDLMPQQAHRSFNHVVDLKWLP